MSDLKKKILEETYLLNNKVFERNMAFRRNHRSYEFSSYINHAIAFYHSENWTSLALFLNRANKFLRENESHIESEYRKQATLCLGLFEKYILEACDSDSARSFLKMGVSNLTKPGTATD